MFEVQLISNIAEIAPMAVGWFVGFSPSVICSDQSGVLCAALAAKVAAEHYQARRQERDLVVTERMKALIGINLTSQGMKYLCPSQL